MKGLRTLLCLILVSATRLVGAQEHFISISVQAGEHSWLTKSGQLDPNASFGIGGGVGVSYELQQKHFLFTLGLQANPTYSSFALLPYSTSFNGYDSELEPLKYSYYFSKRTDNYTTVSVQIPVMLGAQFKRFYFLLGAKLDARVWGRADMQSNVRSDGNYVRFIDVFEQMYEHAFFDNQSVESHTSVPFGCNVLGSVELGAYLGDVSGVKKYSIRKRADIWYRFAFYADCGLLNAFAHQNQPLYSTPTVFNEEDMLSGIRMNDLLASGERPATAIPLQIGVKFTMLFHLPKKPVCVICR